MAGEYDPSLSWVAKIREDGRVAADLFIYMDDLRPTGPDAYSADGGRCSSTATSASEQEDKYFAWFWQCIRQRIWVVH
jgi:hypothetical protein